MMITKLFYFDLFEKNFCQKRLRSKNFRQNLRHQMVEVEAIQKLLLSLSCFKHDVEAFLIIIFFSNPDIDNIGSASLVLSYGNVAIKLNHRGLLAVR